MTKEIDPLLTTTTGHSLSEAIYLDSHYLACKPEYEAMLKSVDWQPGWHVLDAGCGSGGFMPLLSRFLGKTGRIDGIDMAPENVAHVQKLQAQNVYACPVTVQAGTITQLPYEDDTFDGIWCANTTQYLSDNDLYTTLSEFKRVLKPSGTLALKEASALCFQIQPMDPLLWARALQAQVDVGFQYALQYIRGAALPTWVKHAGFNVTRSKTVLTERRSPLNEPEENYITSILESLAQFVKANSIITDEDKASWTNLGTKSSPDFILNDRDFYYCEGHMMMTATKP